MERSKLPAERHHALDLIRGLAALCVAQFHFMKFTVGFDVQSLGTFTVYVFFILSSLTMMLVYAGRFSGTISRRAAIDFYIKRAIRLLPLLAVVTLASYLFGLRSGDADASRSILTGTGLMALQLPGMISTVPGAWSLGIEIGFYLVFPLVALFHHARRALWATFAILLVAQQLLIGQVYGRPQFWAHYNTLLIYAPFFTLGILIFDMPKARVSPWMGLILSLVAFAAMATFSLWSKQDIFAGGAVYICLMGLAALSVALAWRTIMPSPLVRAAQFLGELSYPLYLTHWVALDIAARGARLLHLPVVGQWMLFVAVALAGALAANRLVEQPTARYFLQRKPAVASLP